MSDAAETDIIFDGINGVTGDVFVRMIRRRILVERIHDDDRLIALTASSCLQGPALDWYEDQTEEVQESWKLLRRAILTRWPSSSTTSVPTPTSPTSNIPTPAAAPPNPAPLAASRALPQVNSLYNKFKSGRIRVESEDGRPLGYVSTVLNYEGHCQITFDTSSIATVKLTTKGPMHDLDIITQSSEIVKLGVAWESPTSEQWMIDDQATWGSMVKITGKDRHSSTTETGVGGSNVWSITADGEILVSWEIKPKVHRDLTFTYRKIISVTNDFDGFIKYYNGLTTPMGPEIANGSKIVRLFFEPV